MLALVVAGCTSQPEATQTTAAASTSIAPATTLEASPLATSTTALAPSTLPPRPEPATLAIEPQIASAGDVVRVTATCDDSPVEVAFANPDGQELYDGPLETLQRTILDPSQPSDHRGEIVVPYWLPPGERTIVGFCPGPSLPAPEHAAITVEAAGPEPWDAWRPLELPKLDPPPHDAVPQPAGDEVFVADGDELTVSATCRPEVSGDGARFVVWQRLLFDEPHGRDDDYFAVEFAVPPGGIERRDDATIISAAITIIAEDFPDPTYFEGPILIAGLCTATATPFEPDAERPAEEQPIHLYPAW